MNDTEIQSIHLESQINDENFQFHTEANAVISETDAVSLHIGAELAAQHTSLLARLDEALKNIVKSHKTGELHEADKKRDESYRALVAYVKTMCMHADPRIRAAAERVKIVLDTYNNILKKSYEGETSAIYNLVQDLTSEKYAADVTAIGATQWVSRLSADNNTFSGLMTARDNETAAKTHINVRAARKAVDEAYRSIVLLVNAHARVNATPAIKAFITKINIIVKRFNTLLKQHHSHHGHHDGAAEGGSAEQ